MKALPLLFALGLIGFTLTAGPSLAADRAAEPERAAAPSSLASVKVADFSWITGHWQGEIGDSFIEEQWSGPAGGVIMGMFRLVNGGRDGQVVLYEFFTLEASPEGPILWMRHFSPRLVAREDKEGAIAFRLVSYKPGAATFDNHDPEDPTRLSFRREGEDRLVATLGKVKDGKPVETEFAYRRHK